MSQDHILSYRVHRLDFVHDRLNGNVELIIQYQELILT